MARVIVTGSINGQISSYLTRLTSLHAKNNFHLSLIVGDLFGPSSFYSDASHQHTLRELLDGQLRVPLPTYFHRWRNPLPDLIKDRLAERRGTETAGEVCENLYYLNRAGSLRTSIIPEGGSEPIKLVNIADSYLPPPVPGEHAKRNPNTEETFGHAEYDILQLKHDRQKLADSILLSNDWPNRLCRDIPPSHKPSDQTFLSQAVSRATGNLAPRYSFFQSPSRFYEHAPIGWWGNDGHDAGEPYGTTRFIGLSPFDESLIPSLGGMQEHGAGKTKSMYAFNWTPTRQLSDAEKRTLQKSQNPWQRDVRKLSGSTRATKRALDPFESKQMQKKRRQERNPREDLRECFFCLSSEHVNTRLLVSIGDESYLTLVKGPLIGGASAPGDGKVQVPDAAKNLARHFQLIPLAHVPTLSTPQNNASPENQDEETASRKAADAEMDRYETALKEYTKAHFGPDFGLLTFALSRSSNVHYHRQSLILPADLIRKGVVEAAYKVQAKDDGYPKFDNFSDERMSKIDDGFFRVELWAPGEAETAAYGKTLVMPIPQEQPFRAIFPRMVVAKLLELEGRKDWKRCVQSEQEEEVDAATFKEAFEKFDFALQGSKEDAAEVKAEDGGSNDVLAS